MLCLVSLSRSDNSIGSVMSLVCPESKAFPMWSCVRPPSFEEVVALPALTLKEVPGPVRSRLPPEAVFVEPSVPFLQSDTWGRPDRRLSDCLCLRSAPLEQRHFNSSNAPVSRRSSIIFTDSGESFPPAAVILLPAFFSAVDTSERTCETAQCEY